MLHSQFVPLIVVTMLQNWLGLGHAAFVQKSWLDCGKSFLHTKLGSHHVFFAAMLHSQFVPLIVVTMLQNWLGLGHAAFVQKSWLDCGKSLLHTKLGSHHVFFAAMLHSQFVPLMLVTMLQNWLGLGHASFVQKSWLDCGKSLLHTNLGSHHVFFAAMLHSLFVPHIVVTMLQNWLGLGHAAFVQKSWLDCGKSLLHTKLGSHHVFFAAMLHSQFVPLIVVTMLQNWLGLGHASFVQKSWLDCGKSLLHTKLGSHRVFFAAMLHSLFVPLIVVTMLQNWLGLGHASFVQTSWLDCGQSLLHTKLGSHHVFFAAMLHSLFVPLIVVTMLQSWLGLGHAAFVQKSWLDCGKSLLHTKLGSHHVFFAAMLHSQFVPLIVVTMLQNWLGLGHASFVQKSWLDCGKSLLHTKLGSHHVFFAAMLHSQFVPHIVVTMLQNWLGLGHAAFVQKSWLDCGKSLLHTKLGSHHVFFAAMLHSLFVPHIVVTMLQSWLGLGHAAFVQKSWLDGGKSLLHTKQGSHHVFFAAMLHSQFVPLIVVTMLQNWLGLGHAAFVQKSWLDCGKSLLHTKLGSHHVFFAAMLHSQFVPLIVVTMLQNWLGLGHASFVQKSWLDCGKSLLHTNLGSHHVFFAAMLHSLFVPHIVVTMLQNWLGLGHAAFVQKSWLDCGKSLLHTKLGSHHVFFAAMLHSQFVPLIVVTMLQNWLGLGHAAFVQKSWLDCGKSLLHTKLGSHHVFFAAMLHSQFVPLIVVTMLQNWLGLGHASFVQKSWLDCGKSLLHTNLGSHHVFFAAMLHSLFVPHIVVTMLQNWLGLGHAAFVQKSWLDCGKSLLHTKLGSHHVFFAAMLHSQFVPLIVVTMLQNWLGLGHASFVQKSWLAQTVINHCCTQNWGLTMCFLRQCCTHCLCPSLWSQCSKADSVLAMQPLCRSHGWTVVNHYCTQNWGLTVCFLRQCCTHSLCPSLSSQCSKTGSVLAMHPLCRRHGWTVVNHCCTQNWGLTMCFLRQCCTHSLCPSLSSQCSKTGSVLAMHPLCRQSWLDCGKSLLHTTTGVSPCVFCGNAALTVCAPSLWSQCSKADSVLAMQPLCRSHGWTVVNHYCTQNWGLTVCFLRQCCTHCLCPTLWSQCSKAGSVLAMQPLCRSHGWTVVNHYYTQNRGLTMCFLRQCCTHSLCPSLWSQCSKLARSWPCSLCAEVMVGLC